MGDQTLISRNKLAGSKIFTVSRFGSRHPTLYSIGPLDGAEQISIKRISAEDGTTEQIKVDGVDQVLDANNNDWILPGAGKYEVTKPSGTTNDVGVYLGTGV